MSSSKIVIAALAALAAASPAGNAVAQETVLTFATTNAPQVHLNV